MTAREWGSGMGANVERGGKGGGVAKVRERETQESLVF
jgi:hypothetical protein